MNLYSKLKSLTPTELVEALSIHIYELPLSKLRRRLREVPEALRIPILVLDFDTEVNMSGMLGFLENSTGLYLPETIEAFEIIGATETASILGAIQKTIEKHGVSPAKLRSDFTGTQEYQITTFQELHGDLGTIPEEVEQDATRLYLNAKLGEGEQVWSLLAAYIEKNHDSLLNEIKRLSKK